MRGACACATSLRHAQPQRASKLFYCRHRICTPKESAHGDIGRQWKERTRVIGWILVCTHSSNGPGAWIGPGRYRVAPRCSALPVEGCVFGGAARSAEANVEIYR